MINLEIIRQACIKANPSIIELKKGCVVEVENWGKKEIIGMSKCYDTPQCFSFEDRNENGWFGIQHMEVKSITKILGRPIRLSDVLLALKGNVDIEIEIGNKLDSLVLFNREKTAYWDLKHDNLGDQSEETILFLADLLKEKE